MKPNHPKNQKLIDKYSFLKDLFLLNLTPYRGMGIGGVNDLTIRIQKADGDLMYRMADNIGLVDAGCILSAREDRKGQAMCRGESLFAIGADGQVLNRARWPLSSQGKQPKSPIYAKNVLWKTNHGDGTLSDPIHDQVEYLVWITVDAWHEKTDQPMQPFGKRLDISATVTIYGKPDCGFHELEAKASIEENLFLDSNTLMRAVLGNDHLLLSMSGQIVELCRFFQDEVYFNGMKKIFDTGKHRGAQGAFGPAKVLVAELCGYDRVMLQDANCWITFQLRPGETGMYVHALNGKLPQIRQLVRHVVKTWNENQAARDAFRSDECVRVM